MKIQQILYFLLQKSVFLFQESVLPVFWGRTDKKNVILQRRKQDKTSEVLAMLLLFCMLLSDHRQQTREESLKGVKKKNMRKYNLKVTKLGEPTYLPAPEQGEPDGLWRRVVRFKSLDIDDAEKDEIVATLWDYQAVEYNLQVGDKVIATLQFRIFCNCDGSAYQHVDVVDIEKVSDFN